MKEFDPNPDDNIRDYIIVVDPDFDDLSDDEREILIGKIDHDRAHGIGLYSELTYGMECHAHWGFGQ